MKLRKRVLSNCSATWNERSLVTLSLCQYVCCFFFLLSPPLSHIRLKFSFLLQDLEQYASSYSGLMRIERLQFIADHCPQLRVEALKMALSFVQRTFNVDVYEEIHRKLTEATRQEQLL